MYWDPRSPDLTICRPGMVEAMRAHWASLRTFHWGDQGLVLGGKGHERSLLR